MKKISLLWILGLWVLASCSPQSQEVVQIAPTATLLPIVSQTPRFTATPVSSNTPLPTFTFTPTETSVPPSPTLSLTPTLTPTITGIVQSLQRVNVREGPGVSFNAIDSVAPGTGVVLIGQSSDGAWFNVRLDNGREGWVSSSLLFLPPTPTGFPTLTPAPDLTALFLGTPLPTAVLGGGTVTPTPPGSITTATPGSSVAQLVPTEDTGPTQPFVPVIDLNTINQTATALAAGAATNTPRPTSTTTQTPEGTARAISLPATSAGSVTPDSLENEEISQEQADALSGVDVFAFCDNTGFGIPAPSNLRDGVRIDIYWAWFARTEAQVQEHINAANYELRVNGELIPNVSQYRTRIRPSGGDFVTYWYVPYGPLPAGTYEITYVLSWSSQISDGYESFGPGTNKPFEQETCTFTVR